MATTPSKSPLGSVKSSTSSTSDRGEGMVFSLIQTSTTKRDLLPGQLRPPRPFRLPRDANPFSPPGRSRAPSFKASDPVRQHGATALWRPGLCGKLGEAALTTSTPLGGTRVQGKVGPREVEKRHETP